MQSSNVERDEKGDAIFPKDPEGFWEQEHFDRRTHIFHFLHDGHFFEVDYEKFAFEDMRQDLPKFDLVTYPIFQAPTTPASDEWITWRNSYDYYLERFFRPVLSRGLSDQGFPMKVDQFKFVIPKIWLEEINGFIDEVGLGQHRDFILYLIAKIEYIYVHDIHYYDNREQWKRIRNFPAEIEKLITVLKHSEPAYKRKEEPTKSQPDLTQIVFQYDSEKPIKISDPQLLFTILKYTRKHFEDGRHNDWQKQLRAYPNVYTENQMPNEFRHRICKALHNFFRSVNAFDFTGKTTTDMEMYSIARILDFAHIKFHNKKHLEFDIEVDKADILKIVRNTISRKELVYQPTHFTGEQIKVDTHKLEKYFDHNFIQSGTPIYNQYDVRVVATITDKYNLNKSLPDLVYIFNCLKDWQFKIGHQFECLINREIEQNPDYRSWKKLRNVAQGDGDIENVEVKIKGEENRLTLSEPLSTNIMKKALKEYWQNHPYEFEIDFYESEVEIYPKGAFRLATTGKLHQPGNRFLARFTKQCYAFILNENPPTEKDLKPSDRYFGCIANLLIQSHFFSHQMWDEDKMIAEVEEWYNQK